MSKYPEWAPPELVQRAESKTESDSLLEKLITDESMEKVWETLYKHGMRDSERYENGRFANLRSVTPGDVVSFQKMEFPKTPIGLYQLVTDIRKWREDGTLMSKNELDSGVEEIRAASDNLKALIKKYRLEIHYKGDFTVFLDGQHFDYSEPGILKQLDEYVDVITNMRDDFMVSPARTDGGSAFYAVLFSEAIRQTYGTNSERTVRRDRLNETNARKALDQTDSCEPLDETGVRRIVANLINVLLGTSFDIEDIRKKLWNHTQKMRKR